MYFKIISALNQNIETLEKTIISFSKKQNNIKEIYDRICPRKQGLRVDNLISFLDNSNKLKKLKICFENVRLLEDVHINSLIKLVKTRKDYLNYQREITKMNMEKGITEQMIFSDEFRNHILATNNLNLINSYMKIIENKKRIDEINNVLQEMLETVCNRIINEYELITEQKQNKKELSKTYKDIVSKISKEERLNPRELSFLTDFIDEINDDDLKRGLLEELKLFNEKTTIVIKEIKPIENNTEEVKPIIKYYDDDQEEIKEETSTYTNHLNSLRQLNNKEDIYEYLDSLKYLNNIKIFIARMVSNLSEDEEILRNILIDYATNLDIINNNEVNSKEENLVFYYGITNDRNVILNDLKSISKDYYGDVYNGISKIKSNKINNAKHFQRLKKIQKIREKDIRITFKRISDSTYVILGIYCKKDNKGKDIVVSSLARSEDLVFEEQAIKDAIVSNLSDELIEKNTLFEKEIYAKLNIKHK